MEWVDVKDRLPESSGDCLVYMVDIDKNSLITNCSYYLGFGWLTHRENCEVTHWMPLPNPPKGLIWNG